MPGGDATPAAPVIMARCCAAAPCPDSRGAHYLTDHPAMSDLASSRYTVVRLEGDALKSTTEPVHFSKVRPGESLLRAA